MLTRRLWTGSLLILLLIVIVVLNRWPWACLVLSVMIFFTAFGMKDFYALARRKGRRPYASLGIALGLVLLATIFLSAYHGAHSLLPAFSLLFLCLFALFIREMTEGAAHAAFDRALPTLAGILYVALPWSFLFKILYAEGGVGLVFFLFLVVKGADSAAYFVGKSVGRKKAFPQLSPGKTVEGTLAELAAASLLGAIGAYLFKTGLGLANGLALGLLLGCCALLGDLSESLLKREAGVKDSGSYLPGMGGALDVMDSLLFAGPVMYMYLAWVKGFAF